MEKCFQNLLCRGGKFHVLQGPTIIRESLDPQDRLRVRDGEITGVRNTGNIKTHPKRNLSL